MLRTTPLFHRNRYAFGGLADAAIYAHFGTETYRKSNATSAFGDVFSFTRSGVAELLASSGSSITQFAANTVRRDTRGVLIENAQTNSLRNANGTGATVGTIGSGGAAPTYWLQTYGPASGLACDIVATGTENNVPYVDFRVYGTSSATRGIEVLPEDANQIVAAQNELWTSSVFLKVVSGSLPSTLTVGVWEANSGGTFVASGGTAYTPTGTLLRYVHTRTLTGATTAFVRPVFTLVATNGGVYDFTLRIGLPQIEKWATSASNAPLASAPIQTTTTAVTRGTETLTASLSGLGFGGAHTIAVQFTSAHFPTIRANYLSINDGSANNRLTIRNNAGSPPTNLNGIITNGGSDATGGPALTIPSASTTNIMILGASGTAMRAKLNNGTTTDYTSSLATLSSPTRIDIGQIAGLNPCNGYIRQIVVFSRLLAASEMETVYTEMLALT